MNCPCGQCRRQCSADFVGTFLLVLFGAGIVAFTASRSSPLVLLEIAATFGTVVGVVILAVGRVSGAHVNPTVSLAHSLVGRLGKDMLVPYVVFQSIGALAAGLVLRVVFRPNASSHYLGSTILSVNTALGFALETIGTFTLAFVILRVSTGEKDLKFQALTVGLTLFALILTLGAFTGASFNPARSIRPAVVSGHLDDLWLFITAPLTGGAFAAIVERTRSRG